MAYHISTLLRRDDDNDGSMNPMTIDLLLALVAISFFALLTVGVLYTIRKYKAYKSEQRNTLPSHNGKNLHGLNIDAPPYSRGSTIYYYDEKAGGPSSGASTPCSPVPEIRITFPDDIDAEGRQTGGQVVIVRVGEKGGVGLEPVRDEEQLPKYERDGKKWDELDMDLMGGLKEKKEFV